ncbi:MAG: hypothetical protein SFZ03_07695 [Candidatus Melainabacteria bacterium]|nr:hypothetical protein [Candidatus Melainabacteria bacterium]
MTDFSFSNPYHWKRFLLTSESSNRYNQQNFGPGWQGANTMDAYLGPPAGEHGPEYAPISEYGGHFSLAYHYQADSDAFVPLDKSKPAEDRLTPSMAQDALGAARIFVQHHDQDEKGYFTLQDYEHDLGMDQPDFEENAWDSFKEQVIVAVENERGQALSELELQQLKHSVLSGLRNSNKAVFEAQYDQDQNNQATPFEVAAGLLANDALYEQLPRLAQTQLTSKERVQLEGQFLPALSEQMTHNKVDVTAPKAFDGVITGQEFFLKNGLTGSPVGPKLLRAGAQAMQASLTKNLFSL